MNYRSLFTATLQTTGMFVAGFLIPLLGQAVALFSPVPLILLYARSGRREGWTGLLASCLIAGLLGGWQTAGAFFLTFGVMTATVGEGMRRQWKPEWIALTGGILPVVALAAATAYYFAGTGTNAVTAVEEYLKSSMVRAAEVYTGLGLTETASFISSVSDTFIRYLVRLLPGIIIATSVFQAACCYGVARSILLRNPGQAPQSAPSLALWHAPDAWVWGLISSLGLVLVPGETAFFTGCNLAILFAVVYLVQGVAVADYYLRRLRVQPFMRGLLHTLILALPSVVFVVALGVVDIWADFRKVREPLQPEKI